MIVSTPLLGLGLFLAMMGIALEVLFPGARAWVVVSMVCVVIAGVTLKRIHMRNILFVCLGLFLVFFGMFRVSTMDPVRTPDADQYINTPVTLIGVVATDPDRRASSVQYVLGIESISDKAMSNSEKILVILPRYPEYRVGDALTLSGTFSLPEDFETDPTRPPFPYVRYLAKNGVGYVLRLPQIIESASTHHFPILRMLSGWKREILEEGHKVFAEPEGGLLVGMILGERHALPKDILDDMRVAGLVHIIVVSGYNMTVVAEMVSRMFRFLPLVFRSSIGFILIWVYAGMVSGGAPVVRAAIMTSFALLARMTNNTALALRLLYLSATVMVFHNPRIVLDDASFHLSFLATLGLIVLSPKITAYFSKDAQRSKKEYSAPWWKELFSATLSAQVMVVPYILFFSGQLSPYALPANLLALPVVPMAMGLGTLAVIMGAFFPWMGAILGVCASIPAWWVLTVGKWFASLPGSDVMVPLPLWAMFLLYGLGALFFFGLGKRNSIDVSKE